MNDTPSKSDLAQLREQHDRAVAALDQVHWSGGGPIYPGPINDFIALLRKDLWASPTYDPAITQKTIADPTAAELGEIRQVFTHILRSERFSSGAWSSILKGAMPLPALFDRLEALLAPDCNLHTPKAPVTHALGIAAMRQAKAWVLVSLLPVFLGLLVEYLRTHGHIARGNQPLPLYLMAVMLSLGWIFCLIVGWRGQRELARIRRGDYLAHWTLTSSVTISDEAIHDRLNKVALLFFAPLLLLTLGGLILGGIGTYMKSDWHLLWRFSLGGGAVGLGLGLLLAVPTWLIMGVRIGIARDLPSETIFTHTGFYQPGRFIPVMSWEKGRREVGLTSPDRRGFPTRIEFKLRQGSPLQPNLPSGSTAHFAVPIPPGKVSEAEALVAHYRS